MNRNSKVFILLLINLGLVFLSFYILDMLQIIDYRQVFSNIPVLRQTYRLKTEDVYLLEKVELEKKWGLQDQRIRNFDQDKKKFEEQQRNLDIEKENIRKEKENVQNMIANFEKSKEDQASYDNKVDAIANQLENMPPPSAVKILEKQDDLFIIDILKTMQKRADEAGRQSIVSFLLSLMDPEQSARIQRKMTE